MKYLGSVLILCACICFSFFYEIKEKNKIENLKKIRDFINFIKIKIDFFLTPQNQLFSEYNCKLINELYNKNFDNLDVYFDKETTLFLDDYFKNLGKGLKDEEISRCKYTLAKLNEIITKYENELPNKIKVVRTLAIFGGACVILLII